MEQEILRQKRNLFLAGTILAVVASLFFVAKAATEAKSYRYVGQGATVSNVVSVSGTGEVFAVPDIAQITFTARSEAKDASTAQKTVTTNMNSAIDFLKKSGVEEKDIKTLSYNSYPRYEYESTVTCMAIGCPTPTSKRVLVGYEVSQTVTVKVRKTDDAGKVLEGLGKLKLSEINGPDFTIDDEQTVQAEARKKAIEDAKKKADVLAKDLGVKLVRIVNFSESGNTPMYYKMDSVGFGRGGATESAPQVPTGENKIVSSVMITYEIR